MSKLKGFPPASPKCCGGRPFKEDSTEKNTTHRAAVFWALACTRPGPNPVLCNKTPSPTGKGHLLHRTGPNRRATLWSMIIFERGDSEVGHKVPRTPPHSKGSIPYMGS